MLLGAESEAGLGEGETHLEVQFQNRQTFVVRTRESLGPMKILTAATLALACSRDETREGSGSVCLAGGGGRGGRAIV